MLRQRLAESAEFSIFSLAEFPVDS